MACDPKKTLRSCLAFQQYWKDRPKKEVSWGFESPFIDQEETLRSAHNQPNAQCMAKGITFNCPCCGDRAIVFWTGRWACRSGSWICRSVIHTALTTPVLSDEERVEIRKSIEDYERATGEKVYTSREDARKMIDDYEKNNG